RFGDTDRWRASAANGRTTAIGVADGTLTLWDSSSGEERVIAGAHPGCLALALSPEGATLASGGADGALALWDVATGRQRARLMWQGTPLCALACARAARTLPPGGWDEAFVLWDTATGARHIASQGLAWHAVVSVAFSPVGRSLASTSLHSPAVRLW